MEKINLLSDKTKSIMFLCLSAIFLVLYAARFTLNTPYNLATLLVFGIYVVMFAFTSCGLKRFSFGLAIASLFVFIGTFTNGLLALGILGSCMWVAGMLAYKISNLIYGFSEESYIPPHAFIGFIAILGSLFVHTLFEKNEIKKITDERFAGALFHEVQDVKEVWYEGNTYLQMHFNDTSYVSVNYFFDETVQRAKIGDSIKVLYKISNPLHEAIRFELKKVDRDKELPLSGDQGTSTKDFHPI